VSVNPLAKPSEVDVTTAASAIGRQCGSCSLCCRLLDVPETGKHPTQWCPRCRPGRGGCSIHSERPSICRTYGCGWLINPAFDDAWFPQKCGIAVDSTLLENQPDVTVMRFHVDPRTPNRRREAPHYDLIKLIALRGLRGDSGLRWMTVICVGQQPWLLVLPHKEVEYGPGIAMPVGPDQFEYLRCKSKDAVLALNDMLTALQDAAFAVRQKHPELDPVRDLARILDLTASRLQLGGDA
jgi:hypothetical protein